MYAGKPVETGTVDEIYYASQMPYTIGLLNSIPRLDSSTGEELRPIPGSPPSLLRLAPGCPFSPRCTYRIPLCEEQEPALLPVEGSLHADHYAACHVSDTLGPQR